MATQEHTIPRPFDGLADLADCYEALTLLAFNEDGQSSPVVLLLTNLNSQLRAFLDEADEKGFLS